MRKFSLSIILFLSFVSISFSQTATVRGIIKDGKTSELLEGANVVQLPSNGTVTDDKGNYELKVTPGDVILVISYLGMKADTQHFTVKDGELKIVNKTMGGGPVELQTVVVGESKVGIKLQKATQSVDVVKPRMLESNNITNIQQAVTKIPGVTVLDGQMSIRGGSGYAYGSGSRVMLVVDEMPLMTADRGDIKWAFVPVENVEQMEVIKGASSVQSGSSALNGVINVTTAYARDTPVTKFTVFYEGMDRPPVDSFRWWKRDGKVFENPNTMGVSFLHKQKFGSVDFVISGMMQGSQSHLQQEYDHFARFSSKIRWQPAKFKRITFEVSANLLYRKSGFQFYWLDGGHPYLPASGVTLAERYFYGYIDPKIRFVDKGNNQHKLYGRVYRQNNIDGVTDFWVYRAEYQFRHDFGKLGRVVCGVSNEHATVKDGTLGNHKSDFGAGFLMGEINYKGLTVNAGVREEFYRLDSAVTPTIPVFRLGVNQEIRKYNYLRFSFGQSFRIPSIAERFVVYQLAGIEIRPNPHILPEKGFTAELGYKRSLKIGNWLGYLDAVVFWTEFRNMIEFKFNVELDTNYNTHLYFQSQNVARARIFGWELSVYGEGKIGPVDFTTMFGYTYFYGVDMNDSAYGANKRNAKVGNFILDAFTHFSLPTAKSDHDWDSVTAGMLRYRNPHTFKADFDFIFINKIHIGTSFQYYSYMGQIDKVFGIFIPDINRLRRENRNKGDFIWDLRAGYDFNRNVSLNFLVKNVMNSNYAIRVAKPDKPRTYTVQLVVNFGGSNSSTSAQNAAKRMAAM